MKYITIIEEPYSGKTRKFSVLASETKGEGETLLGEVKWTHYYKQYTFTPWRTTELKADEMTDIATFIQQLMEERRLKTP